MIIDEWSNILMTEFEILKSCLKLFNNYAAKDYWIKIIFVFTLRKE